MRTIRFSPFLAVLFLVLTWSRPAHAYLDPGSANILLQTLVAGVLAAMFAIKHYWHQFKVGVRSLLGGAPPPEALEDASEPEASPGEDDDSKDEASSGSP